MSKTNKHFLPIIPALFLLLVPGCAQQPVVDVQEEPDLRVSEPVVTELESTEVSSPVFPLREDVDHGCSYFYFLSGRHAELETDYAEALEDYQKALICDPDTDYIQRKIPLLLLRLGREDEAIKELDSYLRDHPQASGARMLLARIYMRKKEVLKAAEQFRKVHELDPENHVSLLLLSELYLSNNEPEKARKVLAEILGSDSQSYAAHLMLAKALYSEKEFEQALSHYQQALDINWSAQLQMELAERFRQQKQFDQAVRLYQELLDRNELDQEARFALINLYIENKQEDKALTELNTLKNLSEQPVSVDITMARLYLRKNEINKAADILEQTLLEKESPEARFLLAVIYFKTKDFENSLKHLHKIKSSDQEFEDRVFLEVRTLKELKKSEEALAFLESIIEREEGITPDILVLLASLYKAEQKPEKSRRIFLKGIKDFPDDVELLYEYGLFLDALKEDKQALEIMKQVIEKHPEHAGALNYVGYTWADQNVNIDQAYKYIKRAVGIEPENGYIRDSLGWVYFRQNKLDQAIETLKQALKLSPNDAAIYEHLADVYLKNNESQKALDIYRKARKLSQEEKEQKRLDKKIRKLSKQDEL